MGRVAAALLVLVLVVAGARALRDDDRPVDRSTPEALRAVTTARDVVPGRLVDLRRDVDNGKWEVTLRHDGRDYEVELDPRDLALLRVDYD
jgi:uncharacterized membrane protein YkoI